MSTRQFQELTSPVLDELREVFNRIDKGEMESFVKLIMKTKRTFVVGVGREGLSSRTFAMRLIHLGKTVHWIWDDTTPSIGRGDLLIANCGKGNIATVYHVAQKAKQAGGSVATITANPEGKIAKISLVVVHLPAEVWGDGIDVISSVQPIGCLFEQSLLVWGDMIVLNLMEKMGVSAENMSKRHRNVD